MLPNFIIIGTMKGGTGSLWHYLRIHPEIVMSNPKELDYFIAEKNYPRGLQWYQDRFSGEAKVYGEASPNYTKYPQYDGVPERMHALVPEAKLIYLVRDPIARIIAHYMHKYSSRKEAGSITEALTPMENNRYVSCSQYYMQLQQFLEFYPKERNLVMASEDLRDRRRTALKRIFQFLEVDDSFDSPEYDKVLHKTVLKRRRNAFGRLVSRMRWRHKVRPYLPQPISRLSRQMTGRNVERPVLEKSLEKKLRDCLKDDVDALRKYTGEDFKDWSL